MAVCYIEVNFKTSIQFGLKSGVGYKEVSANECPLKSAFSLRVWE